MPSVTTQYSLHNCVDHLPALFHAYATPRIETDSNQAYSTVKGLTR